MSRNFIFGARKQGDSAQNLNLRCGLGANKRSFGVHRDSDAYGRGLLRSAEYCDLGARRHGDLRSTSYRDVGAGGNRLLRNAKCYDFVACIDRPFRDIGCCDLSASGYSLSQDAWHRGFIAPKYELRSRVNCDYSASVLLNGAAQNSSKFSSDTYCGSSASTYLWCSSSVSACLRRVGTKQGVHLYCKFGANRDTFPRCGFDACGFSTRYSARKGILDACCSPLSGAGRLDSEQNPALGTFCAVRNFLNLHVARDFKNFSPVNLKKFNLAALQFANLKKQIRAGKGVDKSADPYNLTSSGRETRAPRRLGSENKIPAPRRSCFESAAGTPCGSGLWHRGCEAAQNFKRFAPDFTRNFKNFTWNLETESVQNFKISALNFTRNFKNSARDRETGSMQGFGNSGRNFEPKFPQSAKNFKQNFEQNLSQSAKNSDRNSEAGPVRGFKNQNSAQVFLQSIKNFDQNSLSSFPQNGKSYDQNSTQDVPWCVKSAEQNFKLSFSQSTKNPEPIFSQNIKNSERNFPLSFLQSIKNSDRNFKTNSTQNQTEPVSPQELKNSEPCPAQRLGFYAPKFKDERARNFFSHPMRAFVLCACFFAALGALSFLAPDALAIDYVGAHKFYFLFLAPSCIYAAFLLTALPDWTNFEGSLKPVSLAFAACLIAAFIASFLNLRAAAAITGLFWAVFFIFAAWLLWLDKNSNNFSILVVLAAFCACSAAYGASGDEKFLLSFVHINVAAIAVVSYRISVVIGNEALREGGLKDAVFIPNFIYKNLAAFLAFALALASPFLSEAACGFIALGIGFLFLAKLRELHYAEILSRHYMAFYYALQAACAAGYLWLGAALIRGGYAAAPLHIIAICYIYGAILFVGMIAGQRHSGISPLNFPRLSRAALVLALLAGALRAIFAGESFVLYVMIPSALFIAAVALYLINFIPIFLKNPFSADPD